MSYFNPSTGHLGRATPPRVSRGIIVTAITLFALSGLLLGFTAGALTRPKHIQSGTPNDNNTQPVSIQTATPQTTPTIAPAQIKLGCPLIMADKNILQANNSISYSLSVQAADKSASCLHGKPV